LADVIAIAATVVIVYQAWTATRYDARRYFGVSLWTFPSLPPAVIGLCLLAGERLLVDVRRKGQWLTGFTVLVLILVGAAVAVPLSKFDSLTGGSMWWLAIVLYSLMIFPMLLLPPYYLIWCGVAWFARVGGASLASLRHYSGGEPYCKFRGNAFAAVYITLGVISAIMAFFCAYYHSEMRFGCLGKRSESSEPGHNTEKKKRYLVDINCG
jgi:hypothetical protein